MYGYLPVFLGLFEPFGRDLTRSEGSLRSKHSRTKSPSTPWTCANWSKSKKIHHPLLRQFFALAPTYASPECGKALRTGTLATQAKEKAIYVSNIILSAALQT